MYKLCPIRPSSRRCGGTAEVGAEALPQAWMRRVCSMRPGVEALSGEAWVETPSSKTWIDEDRSQ